MSWGPWSGGGDTGEEATRRSDSHPRASTEKWENGGQRFCLVSRFNDAADNSAVRGTDETGKVNLVLDP